jgi:hypothetical protein
MKNLLLKFLFALFIPLVVNFGYGQSVPGTLPQFPGSKSIWKGFARYDFEFEGRECRIVCPDKPAAGNSWIWNARFPNWHTDIDSILLSSGLFVTYINTDEFNGSPEGVGVYHDILSKGKIDLLFVEAAVNDRTKAYQAAEQVRAMEGIVRQDDKSLSQSKNLRIAVKIQF